ncbi:MAG: HD domain-containing protein, partial [Candidatus Aenigmatarchaeota archaeon]
VMQRLRGVKQLGLTNLVFPGDNHTRLEHSIGAYHVAEKMANQLELSKEEKDQVKAAALLHDLGHAPFSHTLEFIIKDKTGKDHMDVTQELIKGERKIEDRDYPTIPEILEDHGISPEKVADLIKEEPERIKITDLNVHDGQKYFGEEKYLYQMIHGSLDVDQLDYLLRDSHYTGAAHGVIDIERLIQTVEIFNGNLVISKGGISAVEGMLVARGLMYSSVYFHKTARIAELMLSKAVDELKYLPEDTYEMTDNQFLSFLEQKENKLKKGMSFQQEAVRRMKYRRLYKKSFTLSKDELMDAENIDLEELGSLKSIRKLEEDLANDINIDYKKILIDIPHENLKLSEPRLTKTGIKIIDDGDIAELSSYSPLARALQRRPTHQYAMMVACPPELREEVRKKARREIMGS